MRNSIRFKNKLGALVAAMSLALTTHVHSACEVDYTIENDWGGGAQISIRITNTDSSPINGYQLLWQAPAGESFASGWNATYTNSAGGSMSASNPASHWNGNIAANGGSVAFGFMIANSAAPADPVMAFTLNGNPCNGDVVPTPTSTPTPTATPTVTPTPTPSPTAKPIPTPGDITAAKAIAEMGQGFNLGQMFDNTQHPRTFAAARAKIDAYYAQGFRNVRIPITWTRDVGGSTLVNNPNIGDVNRNHPRLAVITQVIDYALSLSDMYVVINTHHEGIIKDSEDWRILERLWTDISDIFGDRDARLIFEIINEPHKSAPPYDAMPPASLRLMTGKAYDKIRAVNPKRIIAIGGNRWFGSHEMAETWPNLDDVGGGNDKYLMATFHHYNPWSFHDDNQGDYADNWNDSHISDPMDQMISWSNTVGNGMPIYIGEWGTGWNSQLPTMDCNNIRLWYEKFDKEYAAPRQQPTMVWDDGGWFMVYDHASNSWNNNLYQCIAEGDCQWSGSERFNSACF